MRAESFKTSIVQIPDYCGGTTCKVYAITDRAAADIYDHVMTPDGVFRVMPEDVLQKTCLDKEIDKALCLESGLSSKESGLFPWN